MSSNLLEAVSEVARVAGSIAMKHYRTGVAVDLKADGSPVTIADRDAERGARDWIARRFPKDGIVGEELETVNEGAGRRWIIDPIDGTRSFVRGVPLWGTLVAVCEGADVIAGAAFYPAVDELIAAVIGEGCWWNGARARVSSVERISDSLVMTTEGFMSSASRRAGWDRMASTAAMSRGWGDCYGYLLVATGRAEVMVDPIVNEWDVAALLPCITEAGGVFTSWDGGVTAFGGSAIATNGAVAAEARALIAGSAS